jgi:clathrin heavy chain
LLVNKSGSLMSLNIDESALIGFIMNNCGHITDSKGIASLLASRYGLPGADGMFLEQFNRAISSQDI